MVSRGTEKDSKREKEVGREECRREYDIMELTEGEGKELREGEEKERGGQGR